MIRLRTDPFGRVLTSGACDILDGLRGASTQGCTPGRAHQELAPRMSQRRRDLTAMINEGMSQAEMARRLKCTPAAVNQGLKRYGLAEKWRQKRMEAKIEQTRSRG